MRGTITKDVYKRQVHIDVDTASISRNVVVDVPIVSDANVALDKLNEWAEPKKTAEWQEQIKAWDEENPLGMRRDKGCLLYTSGRLQVYSQQVLLLVQLVSRFYQARMLSVLIHSVQPVSYTHLSEKGAISCRDR